MPPLSDSPLEPDIDVRNCTFTQYNRLFEAHGGTDSNYLRYHFQRFQNTFRRVTETWSGGDGRVVVDVGAHWLHQCLFYALAGCKTEAFNAPTTFRKDRVRQLATTYGINLNTVDDLETGECFYGLPEDSVDIVLFTEILEHLTFNPLRFWKTIYRALKPGGRIVVTTPNYYHINGRAFSVSRFLNGFGGGISVDEVLHIHTQGHHWKEFSMKEVVRYFALLSPDFKCVRCDYTDDSKASERSAGLIKTRLENWFPGLRPGLHVEVELTDKRHGIDLKPEW